MTNVYADLFSYGVLMNMHVVYSADCSFAMRRTWIFWTVSCWSPLAWHSGGWLRQKEFGLFLLPIRSLLGRFWFSPATLCRWCYWGTLVYSFRHQISSHSLGQSLLLLPEALVMRIFSLGVCLIFMFFNFRCFLSFVCILVCIFYMFFLDFK